MTLPNALTLLRILAIPFFAIALWYGHHWQAFIIFVLAGLTDLLDGFIARRFNQKSELGAILDPAADKLLMTTAFVLMSWRTQHAVAPIPVWVAILAISRDVLISLFALLAFGRLKNTKFRPTLLGKLTTGTELVAISLGLLFNALGSRPWLSWFLPEIYYVMAFMVLLSGIHYFYRATGGVMETPL